MWFLPVKIARIVVIASICLFLPACSGMQTPASDSGNPVVETISPVHSSITVMAEGSVIPAKEAALSFTTTGVIENIMVKDGDQVEAEQVLIRLEGNEQIESAIASAELELITSQQNLIDLKEQADQERAQAQLAVAEAAKELDKVLKRLDSKDYRRGDQEQIDIARSNYVLAEEAVDQAEEFYDQVDDRDESDPVRAEAFSQWAAARQRRDQALANLNYLLDKPNDLDVNQINAEVAVAQSNFDEAQRQLEKLKDGPDPALLKLAEKRVETAEVNLEAANAMLQDLELKAPFSGEISSLSVTVGEFITSGAAVAQLVDSSQWLVETTDLTELNIARIYEGQPAMIHFDALPDIGLIGRVTNIKPFGENRQGDIVYTVVLKLETPDERLRWNMTASVDFLEKGP